MSPVHRGATWSRPGLRWCRTEAVANRGANGIAVAAKGNTLRIGREDCELNFPTDIYVSPHHVTIEEKDGHYMLTDHDSLNGTYIRLKSEQPLAHGDYLFIGRKLLRVEVNAN